MDLRKGLGGVSAQAQGRRVLMNPRGSVYEVGKISRGIVLGAAFSGASSQGHPLKGFSL
ncbi:GL13218 [Drosophila persimilis]|uniref:GL13218 n=1 Tax=Drosophila persimilis TaxID=7234 RepID=B4IS65_DROPE|nr:GL13218 [Drosophila persimilis]